MKKIYIFAAVIALLTLSLNAQLDATKKKVVQSNVSTEKVDIKLNSIQKAASNITGNRAPSRAPMRGDRATQTWSWSYGSALPSDWYFGDSNTGWGDNQDGTFYIGVTDSSVQPSEFAIHIPASVFTGYTNNVKVVISAKADAGYNSQTISVNGDTKSITTSLATYTWTNVDVSNGIVINPTDSYTGLASITITGDSESGSGDSNEATICDGTNTSGYLPIYGLYHDEYQINQMIYPENLMAAKNLVGKTLTSMTFYATAALNSKLSGSLWTIKLGTTSQTTFASPLTNVTRLVPADITTVITGYALPTGQSEMTIVFTTPFTYNGGNLLVDFQSTQKPSSSSNYSATNFYGVTQASGTYTGFNSNSSTANPGTNGHYSSTGSGVRNFLPKVTFTYEVEDQHDLAIALSAPATAGAGGTVNVTATVTNNGDFAENGYTVTVTDGTNIVNITAQEELPVGESAEFTVQFTTSTNAGGQTVNYTATVACTDDANASNNTATASTTLKNCPPPENVQATGGQSGTMTWDAPTIPASAVTEGFEDTSMFPEFSLGGITATQHSGAIGNWTLYDSTGSIVYGYQSITVPNLGDPHAWMVFAPGSSQLSQDLTDSQAAHNGNQMMASYCPQSSTIASDHWLISPLLSGDAQTISFYARELTDQYGAETYEIWISSTDNNPSSFSQLGSTNNVSSTDWALQSVSLPAGTKYFAIRHTSTDVFALFVDDITYIPAPELPVSYNIYLEGQLVGNVPSTDALTYTFNNLSDGTYQCAVSAVYSYGESAAVPATFTIATQQDQTDAPVITVSEPDANGNVTVTATGDGTVTLTIDGQTVTGQGSASITLPQHMQTYTVTASATAQAAGELVSPTTTQQVTVPGRDPNGEWTEMDGTYDDPNTLLSFLKDGEDIMLLDQFVESTLNNEQPSGYIYTLKENQNGETKTSTPVPIPVYKTNSTMQGFYTYNQIKDDIDMHLKPQVINSKMTYDVAPDADVLYYSLYRGNVGEDYPVIDVAHRVSQLQGFEEKVGEYSQFFMFESHPSGVAPRYDRVGNSIVERLDTNYVQGVEGDEISYVPVIWTKGSNSGRGDGKDNSYGSDIKRETLGAVEPYSIEIERSNGSSWGKWTVPGTTQEYCVYIPTVTINGTVPAMMIANDGDKSTYVPFMYRAWVTYPAARAFSTDSETGSLIDLGPMELPHLLGTEYSESAQAVITDKWDPGDGVLQCSFGGPADEYVNYDDVTFVVRLYYKKVVTEGDNTGSRLGDDPDDAEEYYIVQGEGSATDIETALREMFGAGAVPVSVTYVNAQGMQSSKPFDGLNIVVTRYSDGSTTTSKMVR